MEHKLFREKQNNQQILGKLILKFLKKIIYNSPYRQKRSLSSFQIINGIGKYLNKRSKRKTNNREEGVQELLDVVGLIRVLDNSDDIQYFG